MSDFKTGDKVIVVRNRKQHPKEWEFSDKYPAIGMTGILGSLFDRDVEYLPNCEWIIAWDKNTESQRGDLVKEWMIKKHSPEWDE